MGKYRRSTSGWHALALVLLAATSVAAEPSAPLTTGSLPPAKLLEGSGRAVEVGERRLIVLGFAGDLGFSGTGDMPSAEGSVKHGSVIPWMQLARSVAPILAADANFANLETVISASRSLTPIEKSFTFLGDPAGLRAVVGMGFSVLTAANNHAQDFGPDGIVETLSYLGGARAYGLKAHAGIGIGAARYQPAEFRLGSATVGLAAIGLAINHAGPEGPGQPLYASPQDFQRVVTGLADTGADIRVLSVHYGKELASLPTPRDMARFRSTVDNDAARIVFGHHTHVASGIEYRNGGLILYGLGNFMHTGTQDMSRYGACRDFGLYAKVYLWSEAGQPPFIRALEVVPLRGMHAVPEPLGQDEAMQRIAIVNTLNRAVSEKGKEPLRLETTSRASGLACFGDQSAYDDELAARCRAAAGPLSHSVISDNSLLSTCGTEPAVAPPAILAEQPPIPVAKPIRQKSVKAVAAGEKPKAKGALLQKLFD